MESVLSPSHSLCSHHCQRSVYTLGQCVPVGVEWPPASLLLQSVQPSLTVRSVLHSPPFSPRSKRPGLPMVPHRAQVFSMAFKTLHNLVPPHPPSLISLCSLTRKSLFCPSGTCIFSQRGLPLPFSQVHFCPDCSLTKNIFFFSFP